MEVKEVGPGSQLWQQGGEFLLGHRALGPLGAGAKTALKIAYIRDLHIDLLESFHVRPPSVGSVVIIIDLLAKKVNLWRFGRRRPEKMKDRSSASCFRQQMTGTS